MYISNLALKSKTSLFFRYTPRKFMLNKIKSRKFVFSVNIFSNFSKNTSEVLKKICFDVEVLAPAQNCCFLVVFHCIEVKYFWGPFINLVTLSGGGVCSEESCRVVTRRGCPS